MKTQLVFDTSDATSIAHSDSVGAYLRSSDGTLLTHTTVGGKEALDVRVAEGINVEVDLSHVDDSVAIGDGTDLLDINADGSINAVVSATDLDIRDLSASQDNVAISDGTDTMGVNADGSINAVVTATQLDIDDLNATDDAVQAWTFDGSGNAIGSTGGSLDVNVTNTITVSDAALADTAIAAAANTLDAADTAEDIVASPLASRKYLLIQNMDNKRIYIGQSGVSAANGFPISPGAMLELRAGPSVDIEFVGSASQTPEIRTLELS